MVDEESVHEIFLTDPIDLLKYVGRFVKISLENGEVVSGTVYTIDPVSRRVSPLYLETNNWRKDPLFQSAEEEVFRFKDRRLIKEVQYLNDLSPENLCSSRNMCGVCMWQFLILIYKELSEELSLKIILNHSVTSMEIMDEIPVEQQGVLLPDLFTSQQSSGLTHSKEDVINWLEKNLIPVTENGDKLVIDSLEIHPPYGVDQCYSGNSIVLSRIQKLLRQMPCKNS